MLDQTQSLPDNPSELRSVAVQLAATVKSQALRIAKLVHQLAGHRRHRFGASSETIDQLELKLEEEVIAAATIAPPALPDAAAEPKHKPKRKPLPDNLPRNEEVLSPGDACMAHIRRKFTDVYQSEDSIIAEEAIKCIADHKITKLDELMPWSYAQTRAQQLCVKPRQGPHTGRSRFAWSRSI